MKRFFSTATLLALGVSLVFAGGGQQSSGGQQGGAAQPPNKVITINTWAVCGLRGSVFFGRFYLDLPRTLLQIREPLHKKSTF